MLESHVIEVAGQFAGAAVSHQGRFRFVAVDARAGELNNSLWSSPSEVRDVVGRLMRTGLMPPRSTMQVASRMDPAAASGVPPTVAA